MENLPKENQPVASRLNFFLFLALGLVILILIGEGIYWLKLNKEKKLFTEGTSEQTETEAFLSEEEKFYADITRVFGGEDNPGVKLILEDLERAKTIDPKKSEIDTGQYYRCYTSAASSMIAEYYASGDKPEKRNPEMLKLLAQVREMARQSSRFDEKDWVFEAVDSY